MSYIRNEISQHHSGTLKRWGIAHLVMIHKLSIVPSSAHDFSKKRAEVEKMGSDVM
jgi:hypothetical protein